MIPGRLSKSLLALLWCNSARAQVGLVSTGHCPHQSAPLLPSNTSALEVGSINNGSLTLLPSNIDIQLFANTECTGPSVSACPLYGQDLWVADPFNFTSFEISRPLQEQEQLDVSNSGEDSGQVQNWRCGAYLTTYRGGTAAGCQNLSNGISAACMGAVYGPQFDLSYVIFDPFIVCLGLGTQTQNPARLEPSVSTSSSEISTTTTVAESQGLVTSAPIVSTTATFTIDAAFWVPVNASNSVGSVFQGTPQIQGSTMGFTIHDNTDFPEGSAYGNPDIYDFQLEQADNVADCIMKCTNYNLDMLSRTSIWVVTCNGTVFFVDGSCWLKEFVNETSIPHTNNDAMAAIAHLSIDEGL